MKTHGYPSSPPSTSPAPSNKRNNSSTPPSLQLRPHVPMSSASPPVTNRARPASVYLGLSVEECKEFALKAFGLGKNLFAALHKPYRPSNFQEVAEE